MNNEDSSQEIELVGDVDDAAKPEVMRKNLILVGVGLGVVLLFIFIANAKSTTLVKNTEEGLSGFMNGSLNLPQKQQQVAGAETAEINGPNGATLTPVPTKVIETTPTVAPTATSAPTNTPSPTNTPAPQATDPPAGGSTPTSTPSPTVTPSVTPTPTDGSGI